MISKVRAIGLLLSLPSIFSSCEIDTSLKLADRIPITVTMSGNGTLSRLAIVGHRTLRNIAGPDSSAVWQIKMKNYENGQTVSSLSPIEYGKLPRGYVQVYPEQGEAPELEENVTYLIDVETMNANGARGYFKITDGKVKFAKYEYLLESP